LLLIKFRKSAKRNREEERKADKDEARATAKPKK
jgi:hypothetical protein